MQGIKAKDVRDKSVPELEEMVAEERQALFQARRDLVFRQITDTSMIKTRRKNIARLLTIINEKKRGDAE